MAIRWLAILLVVVPLVARAQSPTADQLFAEGERLLAAGKTAEACAQFEASNRVDPSAGTLINLGMCQEKLGKLATALSAYRDALARVKDPRKKKVATERAAALEPRVSSLTIAVAADARVTGLAITRNGQPVDAATLGQPVVLDGGTYEIAASAPGREPWKTSIVVAVERDRASVTVPRLAETAPVAVAPRPVVEPVAPSTGDDRPMLTTRRKIALGVGIAGLAALGAGVALGVSASNLEEEAFILCPDPSTPCADAGRATELLDRGSSRALQANIAYGVGAAAVIGAAVLWFTGGSRDDSSIAIVPHAGGSGVVLQGRF